MIDYIKDRIKEKSTWIGLISVAASGIMIFTPDAVDTIIETFLFVFGIGSVLKQEIGTKKK